VLIYDDDDDAFAHSPSVALHLRPPSAALPSREYAAEAVMYILRGHSITEPNCQCAHGLSDARARQLGVTPDAMRGPHCSLQRHPSVSLLSLERELALSSPIDYVDATHTRLFALLAPYHDGAQTLRVPRLRNQDDLWRSMCDNAPLPLRLPAPEDSYLHMLQARIWRALMLPFSAR
jgi:hypothetical protein